MLAAQGWFGFLFFKYIISDTMLLLLVNKVALNRRGGIPAIEWQKKKTISLPTLACQWFLTETTLVLLSVFWKCQCCGIVSHVT